MVDLKNLKKVKSVEIDKFDGEKSKIEIVEATEVEKKDFGNGLKEVRQIIVKTGKLNDEEDLEVRGIEYISMKKDEDGEWGIAENPNSKAMKFLKYFKVDNFEDLKGKECLVVKRLKDNGKEFLGIQHG